MTNSSSTPNPTSRRDFAARVALAGATVLFNGFHTARGQEAARPKAATPPPDLREVCRNIRGFQHFAPYAETLEEMWGRYDHAAWERDLEIARQVGANTLRFWLSPAAHASNPQAHLDALARVLDLCEQKGMVCIVSFFNAWRTIYPERWGVGHILPGDAFLPFAHRYDNFVRDFARRFGTDRRILMWEICNEPEALGNDDILLRFLGYWYGFLKGADVQQPVSIGLENPWYLERTAQYSDVLNFHTYETDAAKLESLLLYCKNIAARLNKPLFCSETGTGGVTAEAMEANRKIFAANRWNPRPGGQEAHRENIRLQTALMEKHGIGYVLPWLVEGRAADTCDERQSNLGNLALFHTDGTPRAGGSILKWDKKLPLPKP